MILSLHILALLLLLAVYFALASRRVLLMLWRFTGRPARPARALLLAALLAVPYLLVAIPQGEVWPGLPMLLAFVLVPTLLLSLRPVKARPFDLCDILAILAIWLPVEFDLLPETAIQLGSLSLPAALLTAICLGFFLFQVVRPLGGLGYTYRLTWADLLYALLALLAFFAVGLPFGLATGFITVGVAATTLPALLARFVVIYFLNALPEELLFRGALQNLIQQRWGPNWKTLLVSALIFGLSHLNNTTAQHAPPNWLYVIMATFAGLAYGWVWRERSKITASAITHTLVNFVWSIFFHG